MRRALVLCLLLVACGRSREVQVDFADPFAAEVATRVEVQIARGRPGLCEELIWTRPLPAELGPVVTISRERDGATMRLGDETFDPGEPVVALARVFDEDCFVFAAGCEESTAGQAGPLQVTISDELLPLAPCVGRCEPGGRCAPLDCSGTDAACSDGNREDGDGCSFRCEVEPGYRCPPGAPCEPYTSCRDYADEGHLEDGVYPVPAHGHLFCDMTTGGGGWSQVGRAWGGEGTELVDLVGWSTEGDHGVDRPYAGPRAGFPGFKLSQPAIRSIQGSAPQVMIRHVFEERAAPRFTAPGCEYQHIRPATGACAVMLEDPEAPPGPLPDGGAPDTLGAGAGDTAANDPARGWRLPAYDGGGPCTGRELDCDLELFVR